MKYYSIPTSHHSIKHTLHTLYTTMAYTTLHTYIYTVASAVSTHVSGQELYKAGDLVLHPAEQQGGDRGLVIVLCKQLLEAHGGIRECREEAIA